MLAPARRRRKGVESGPPFLGLVVGDDAGGDNGTEESTVEGKDTAVAGVRELWFV